MNMVQSLIVVIIVFLTIGCEKSDKRYENPDNLVFPNLNWSVPDGSKYRTKLDNGIKLYIAEDRKLPLVTIKGILRGGSLVEKGNESGVSVLTATMLRKGGTKLFSPDSLNSYLEHYAISLDIGSGESSISFKIKFLSEYTDNALLVLEQVLFHPVFDERVLRREENILKTSVMHRFDNPAPISAVAFEKFIYPAQKKSELLTVSAIDKIDRKSIEKFYNDIFAKENLILSVAGDFEKQSMLKRLNELLGSMRSSKKTISYTSVKPLKKHRYIIVQKDISQAYVRMGVPAIKRPNPDYYPLSIFNWILGGGGFTSRLGTKVRSDQGLTYSIYSTIGSNYIYSSPFYISFFTKSESVNKAIALTLSETNRLLRNGFDAEELTNAKKSLTETFPSMFRSKNDIVQNYAMNEFLGRKADHFMIYREKINAIKKEDVLESAKKYVVTKDFLTVIVGDTTALFSADSASGFNLAGLRDSCLVITPKELADNVY